MWISCLGTPNKPRTYKKKKKSMAERAEAAYQMMLNDQMAKTTATMSKFAAN